MYLNTVICTPECMWIQVSMMYDPRWYQRIIIWYQYEYVDSKGFVYFEITKAVYALVQLGGLADNDLTQHFCLWKKKIIQWSNVHFSKINKGVMSDTSEVECGALDSLMQKKTYQ